MAYNSTTYKQRSTNLAGLDCGYNIKHPPQDDNFPEASFTATSTTVVAMGEYVGMIRVAANTIILGAELFWDDAAPAAIVAIGDPFACARLLGPIHVGTARGTMEFTASDDCGPWGRCGSLTKMGTQGDGCGFGYRYTCDTDIVLTNLYNDDNATVGGWAGSSPTTLGQVGAAINLGTYRLILHTKKATSIT